MCSLFVPALINDSISACMCLYVYISFIYNKAARVKHHALPLVH